MLTGVGVPSTGLGAGVGVGAGFSAVSRVMHCPVGAQRQRSW